MQKHNKINYGFTGKAIGNITIFIFMKTAVILIFGILGVALVIRGFIKNISEIRKKPKESHSPGDKYFNYPIMVLWYGYLLIFFIGLMINNLIIR